MFTKHNFNKICIALFGILFLYPQNSFALDTPVTINGKCVSRIITYTAVTAKPENGIQVNPAYGYVNVYVLNGSDFSYSVQQVSGILAKSPSQAFYYDYRASTIIPGNYAGYDFAGNTSYLSMGSASLFLSSDTSYSCNGGAGTVLGGVSLLKSYNVSVSISTPGYTGTVDSTGAGYYKAGSQVTLSVPNVNGYVFDKWYGSCNLQSVVSINYSSKPTYYYTISNLSSDCSLTANFIKQELVFSTLFHRIELYTTGHGSVTLSGVTSASTTGASASASVRDGDIVTYSTTPDAGYVFSGWSGSLYGNPSSGSIQSDRDKVAQATFTSNTLVSSSTVTCIDNPGTIYVTTNPYGAGAIHHNYPTSVNEYAGVSLTSLHLGPTYSASNGSSCTNGFLVEPIPYSGYVFSGWSGDSNVATGTIVNLTTDNTLRKGDWITAGGKVITANFTYTGVANTNGEVPISLTEPVFNPVSDTVAQLFDFDQKTISRSPLTIDGQCVNRVLTFEGTRMASDGTGLLGFVTKYIPVQIFNPFTAPTHTYTIYSLEGSTLTQSQDTGLVTFKSAPSNFIYGYDVPVMKSGSYQSDNQNYFTGKSDTYTFKNFHKISFNAYDCSHGKESLSIKDQLLTPSAVPMFKGFNYTTLLYTSFVDCASNCRADSGVYNPYSGHDDFVYATSTTLFDNYTLNGSYYSVIDCTAGYGAPYSNDIGCPGWLYDYNLSLFEDYRYIWIISSQPVKHLLHRQAGDISCNPAVPASCVVSPTASSSMEFLQFDVDKVSRIATSTLINPFTGATSSQYIYVSRINLENCVPYTSIADYGLRKIKLVSWIYGFASNAKCPNVISSNFLNSLVFDSVSSAPSVVYNFGMYLTSSSVDLTTYSASKIATNILGSVYDPITGGIAPVDSNGKAIGGNRNVPDTIHVPTKTEIKAPKSYSTPTYSAPINETLDGSDGYSEGYSSSLASVTAYMENTYDLNQCFIYHATSTSLLSDLGCVLKNTTMQIITTLIIPSSNNLKSLQETLFATTSPTSLITSALAIPFRFANWGDLKWYPNWSYSQYASSTYTPLPGYYTYTATTTINGYYDAPVYHATTTTSTTTYATLNPSDKSSDITLSNGNLTATAGGSGYDSVRSTVGTSTGKWYWEWKYTTVSSQDATVGFAKSSATLTNYFGSGYDSWGNYMPTGNKLTNGANTAYGTAQIANDVVMLAMDLDNQKLYWGKNGTWFNSGNPVTGANPAYSTASGTIFAGFSLTNPNVTVGTVNFGASTFSYTPPTGFNAGLYSLQSTSTPGYYDAPVYHATTSIAGFFTYNATSTTAGTYTTNFNTGTSSMPYLTVGFSSTTRFNLIPATATDLVATRFAVPDKMLYDWLSPFLQFFFVLFIAWRAYKLIIL